MSKTERHDINFLYCWIMFLYFILNFAYLKTIILQCHLGWKRSLTESVSRRACFLQQSTMYWSTNIFLIKGSWLVSKINLIFFFLWKRSFCHFAVLFFWRLKFSFGSFKFQHLPFWTYRTVLIKKKNWQIYYLVRLQNGFLVFRTIYPPKFTNLNPSHLRGHVPLPLEQMLVLP